MPLIKPRNDPTILLKKTFSRRIKETKKYFDNKKIEKTIKKYINKAPNIKSVLEGKL